jgi:hypothetical protein
VPKPAAARTGERPGAHAGRSTGSARTTSARALTQRPRRTKGGTAHLLRRSLIAVREFPGIFPVDFIVRPSGHTFGGPYPGMGCPGKGEHDGATAGQEPPMRYAEWRRHSDNGAIALPRREPQTPRRPAGTCCTRPTMRSFPPARHAPPRCWKSCGTRSARTTPITPVMAARARGTAPCAWFTVSCMASSSRFGGGMGSRPRRAHSRLGGAAVGLTHDRRAGSPSRGPQHLGRGR